MGTEGTEEQVGAAKVDARLQGEVLPELNKQTAMLEQLAQIAPLLTELAGERSEADRLAAAKRLVHEARWGWLSVPWAKRSFAFLKWATPFLLGALGYQAVMAAGRALHGGH